MAFSSSQNTTFFFKGKMAYFEAKNAVKQGKNAKRTNGTHFTRVQGGGGTLWFLAARDIYASFCAECSHLGILLPVQLELALREHICGANQPRLATSIPVLVHLTNFVYRPDLLSLVSWFSLVFSNLSAPNRKSQIASDFKSRSPNRKNVPKIAVRRASNRTFTSRDLCSEPLFK